MRQSADLDEAKIVQLESLFASGKKIKVDELVKILSPLARSDVK
jgi:hypothetical protein